MGTESWVTNFAVSLGYRGVASREGWRRGERHESAPFEFVGTKADGAPWHVEMTEYVDYTCSPCKTTYSHDGGRLLTDAEYRTKLAEFGGIEDTPEFYRQREERARREQAAKAKAEANKQAHERLRPECPDCRRQMVVRMNSKTRTKFWGCSGYPDCEGSRAISRVTLLRLRELGYA